MIRKEVYKVDEFRKYGLKSFTAAIAK